MISLLPVKGLPEIRDGDDLAAMVAERIELEDGDVVVVAQKAVSKAEGRVVSLDEVEASDEARVVAGEWCDPRESEVILRESARIVRIDDLEPSAKAIELAGDERDPREVEAVLREAKNVVRERGPLVIAETRHGFICASAGVDHSNAPEPGTLVLLPVDPDASARRIRDGIETRTGKTVGVVVTDSFGRPFRQGTTDVALGVAGIPALIDLRGTTDRIGYVLRSSRVAIADEIAAAADLARGKAEGVPVVVVRGLELHGEGSGQDIVIEPELDLFR